jgi:hypothetical protein
VDSIHYGEVEIMVILLFAPSEGRRRILQCAPSEKKVMVLAEEV